METATLGFLKLYSIVRSSYKRPAFFSLSFIEHIYRELSFCLTPLFLKLNITANATSYINLAIGVIAALLIFSATSAGFILGIFVFLFSEVVDRVDGNISRVCGTSTFYGKFVDGFIDIVTLTLLRLALAYWAYAHFFSDLLVGLGIVCAVLTPFHHLMFDRYSAFARWINESTGLKLKPYIRTDSLTRVLNALDDAQYVALMISLFCREFGLLLYFVINIANSSLYLFFHLQATHEHMRVKKISPKLAENFNQSSNRL